MNSSTSACVSITESTATGWSATVRWHTADDGNAISAAAIANCRCYTGVDFAPMPLVHN